MFLARSIPLAVRLPATCLWLICLIVLSSWCLDRFWLYHEQNRVLQPDDYTVSVVPVASGASADQRLSDDGRFAVKVITRGTSHAMDRITNIAVPPFFIALIGLIATVYFTQRSSRQVE